MHTREPSLQKKKGSHDDVTAFFGFQVKFWTAAVRAEIS
jgi:hypothetical protein